MANEKDTTVQEETTAEKEMRILTAGKSLWINGKEVQVKPYSWVNTLKLGKPLSVVVQVILAHNDGIKETLQEAENQPSTLQLMKVVNFLGSIEEIDELTEALTEMVKLSSALTEEEIHQLFLDDFLKLAMAAWEVNRDFFVKRLRPMVEKVKPQIKGKAAK